MNNSKYVLLVEDDTDDQYFFLKALNEIANANLLAVANNGKEALEKLESLVVLPDIIFMDINMPLMDGIECLEEMVKNTLINSIPVVMLSTDRTKMDTIHRLGARAFIEKTADFKSLHQQMEQMINLDFMSDDHIAKATLQANQ